METQSAIGQIVVGVSVLAIGGIGGWFLKQVVAPAQPPIIAVTPKETSAMVGLDTGISANVPTQNVEIEWRVAGQEIGQTHVAHCERPQPEQVSCRFLFPGTFSVSATAIDSKGLQTTDFSSVSVVFPDGYYTVYFADIDENTRIEAYRALLRGVDWVTVQQSLPLPIILYDPDLSRNVYAAETVFDPNYNDLDVLAGLRVRVPRVPPDVETLLLEQLYNIGMSPVEIPAGEVYPATSKGLLDAGFVAFSDPNVNLLKADIETLLTPTENR